MFNDSISCAWMWCSYVQILKSFALFVLEISRGQGQWIFKDKLEKMTIAIFDLGNR